MNNLTKTYGRTTVLSIPNLEIQSGEIIGLVGNNGAGKTTLFQLMLDFIPTSTGRVSMKGKSVRQSEHWKKFTSAYVDEHFLIEFLTAEEFFYFVADARGVSNQEAEALLDSFQEVFNDEVLGKNKYLRSFSKGNQKKVGLVSTLIGNPDLIIWDEPFANLDPRTQLKFREVIRTYSKNRTWIISSHDLSHIVEVCTRIIILNRGVIVKDVKREDTTLEELYEIFQK